MNDFYTKLFGFSIRELTDKFAALEKEQTELVLLKTEISTNLIKAERQIKRRESTPIKSVFFVNEPVEKIRDLAQSLGGGFKESKTSGNSTVILSVTAGTLKGIFSRFAV